MGRREDTDTVAFRMLADELGEVEEIAWKMSRPDSRVSRADLFREAIRDYVERFEEEGPQTCKPGVRGQVDPPEPEEPEEPEEVGHA